MWRTYLHQGPLFSTRLTHATGMPKWVIWPAIVATIVVIIVPLIALMLIASLLGLTVFFLLACISSISKGLTSIWQTILSFFGKQMDVDGRQNVRVVQRENQQL